MVQHHLSFIDASNQRYPDSELVVSFAANNIHDAYHALSVLESDTVAYVKNPICGCSIFCLKRRGEVMADNAFPNGVFENLEAFFNCLIKYFGQNGGILFDCLEDKCMKSTFRYALFELCILFCLMMSFFAATQYIAAISAFRNNKTSILVTKCDSRYKKAQQFVSELQRKKIRTGGAKENNKRKIGKFSDLKIHSKCGDTMHDCFCKVQVPECHPAECLIMLNSAICR